MADLTRPYIECDGQNLSGEDEAGEEFWLRIWEKGYTAAMEGGCFAKVQDCIVGKHRADVMGSGKTLRDRMGE